MTPFSNLIRLSRPGNLLIVAVTMLVVRFFVVGCLIRNAGIGMEYGIGGFDFFLQIMVAVMLTAAGNIINDYFDQKVDRINKPDKVIVGKHVKRRVAIILHQSLNIGAILITLYLCMKMNFWWPMVFPVVIATLLWWYSPYLKKKAFIGNFAIALCTGAVPIWAGTFEMHELRQDYYDLMVNGEIYFMFLSVLIYALSAFAFLLTLIREAQKDMEDIPGDQQGGYQTLPIRHGVAFTKKYVYGLMSVYFLLIFYFLYFVITKFPGLEVWVVPAMAVLLIVPSVLSLWTTVTASAPSQFHKASRFTKWMMLSGMLSFSILSYMLF